MELFLFFTQPIMKENKICHAQNLYKKNPKKLWENSQIS
jgi:hypothetical protein